MYKHIIVTFFTAILTVVMVYGGYTIYAAQEDAVNFRFVNDYYSAFRAYHEEMNDFFNAKIKKLITVVDQGGYYQNSQTKKNFLPPADLTDYDDIPTILKKCGEENLSTYCLSIGALDKYSAYIKKLNEVKNNFDQGYLGLESNISTVSLLSDREQQIAKEATQAQDVMEATIGAYNELRLAYPMHKKYQEILTQLTKYKLALKDIRKRSAEFPIRFVDASTSQCK